MSLPPARKDLSEHPAPGTVVDPVNREQKDADIDRKLRFYGVIEAFRQGRMPDNSQIDRTLAFVRDHPPLDINKLSPEGNKLIQDVRDIVETARLIVSEKNEYELFQNFIWHTRSTDIDRAKQDPDEVLPASPDKARADSQEAVRHLRTLLSLVLTNSEVRKLLSDFSIVGRDLLAKGAVKAAEVIRPDEERLQRVDHPAPEKQFITEGGRAAGPDETPVLEARVPGTDTTVSQHPRDDPGAGTTVRTGDGQVRNGEQAVHEGRETAQNLQAGGQERTTEEARAHGEDLRESVESAPTAEEKKEVAKNGVKEKMMGIRDNLLDRLPQDKKDRVGEHYERSKHFLSEEYFPEERRDQFIYRGKKVIVECQQHEDYQQSIRWLLGYLEEYAGHSRTVVQKGQESHRALTGDEALKAAFYELRTLLERFANGRSLDVILDAVNLLSDDARDDEELRSWFHSVDAYIRKVLLEPGYVLDSDCNDEANQLRDSGRRFYDDKYKNHFDNLFDSAGSWFRAMGDDPLNQRFGEDWARLTKDLLFDSDGNLKFKSELWGDIRRVILPTLIDKVGYIPIPRIEYTDDSLDLVVENLTLSGRNLFPNIVSMEAHNFIKFSPYNTIRDESYHEFTLTFAQVQADMRDIAFYFRKKSGIKIKDSGLADVVLGGEGLTITAHLTSSRKDRSSVFKVKNVNVKVDSLKFSIRDSKHDILYNTLRPLATGLVKRQIQKALQDSIKTGLEYVDGQLAGVRDRMEEAKASDEKNRRQVLQELFQRKQEEAASVKSGTTAQFKVVSKRESVLLPEHGHPAGWINRQADRQEAASKGSEWRSEAFTIV